MKKKENIKIILPSCQKFIFQGSQLCLVVKLCLFQSKLNIFNSNKQKKIKLKIDLFFFSIRAVAQFSQFYSSK